VGVIWLPVMVGAYSVLKRQRYVMMFAAGGYLSAILVLQPPLARYYLPVGPVLLLCFVTGVRHLASRLGTSAGWSPQLAVGTVLVLMAFNLPKDLRQVYRQHQPNVQSSPQQSDLVHAAAFLRDDAGGDDRFVMGRRAMIVAFMSGIDCLRIEKSLAQQQLSEREIRNMLARERITYVVVRKAPWPARTLHDVVRHSIRSWDDYRLVHDHGQFQVFHRVPDDPRLPSAHGDLGVAGRVSARTGDRSATDSHLPSTVQ
jgi:hypothetical protein